MNRKTAMLAYWCAQATEPIEEPDEGDVLPDEENDPVNEPDTEGDDA